MAWLSRNNFAPSDRLHADDLNNLANDQRTWGGPVNGGGYTLSNVVIASSVLRASTAVTSVFGRIGDVVAVATDYTPAFIGAVPVARQVIAGLGMSGGGALSADVTLNALVQSVFGRTGVVTLTPTDITGASGVLSSRQILTASTSGLTGGGNLTADLNLAVKPDSVNQQVQVLSAGTLIGTRHAINFTGTNVTVTDDSTNNRVNIAVTSTGGGGMTDPTTTLGDLIVRGPSAPPSRLAVGATNGLVLTVDSGSPLGMKWAAVAGVSVSSVFGRTGAVVATSGDYTAAMVTNAVDATKSYVNPPWIASLPWSTITGAPIFLVDPLTKAGDLLIRGQSSSDAYPVGADGTVLIADSTLPHGMKWGSVSIAAGAQTPWLQNVDAANFNLSNVGAIGVGLLANAANARLNVIATAKEDGLRITNASTTGWSEIGLYTDQGVVMEMIGWGSANTGPFSDVATIHLWKPLLFCQNSVEMMRLTTSGALGIGTKTPGYELDVTGDANVSGTYRINGVSITSIAQSPWTENIEGANYMLNNVGGIGIGAPASPGLLISQTNPIIQLNSPNAADNPRVQWIASSTTYGWEVGVGLTSLPGVFYIRNMLGGVVFQVDTDGNIGMGHPPNYALDVTGSINCSGQFLINGIAIGGVGSIFGRTGTVIAQTGDYTAAQVTNAVDTTQVYNNPTWIGSIDWSKISNPPGTGVTSVFGRQGVVTAQSGDYTVGQIIGAVPNSRLVGTSTGLQGGGDLTQNRTLSVVADSIDQRVQVLAAGTLVGTRHALNFVNGANVTISLTDDSVHNWVEVDIATSGGTGGGGMVDPTTTVGDLIVRGTAAPNRLPVVSNQGWVLTVDSAQTLGVKWAAPPGLGAGTQTPWVSNIDAANYSLNNANALNSATVSATSSVQAANVYGSSSVQVGSGTASYLAVVPLDIAWYSPTTSERWSISKRDPESTGNAGSDLLFYRYDDTGTLIDAVITLIRSTGRMGVGVSTPAYKVDVAGDINCTGNFRINGTALVSGVSSVFTRTGAVVAQTGDYTAAQITNAVSTILTYSDPAWLSTLSWSKIIGAPAFLVNPLTTQGDLITYGTAPARLGAGTNGQVLTADNTTALGLKWATPAPGGVTSWNTRTGAVVPASGDYTASQVTNAVSVLGAYADPAWITSLSWTKITGAPTGGNQTPWLSDIDAAGYHLRNLGAARITGSLTATNAPNTFGLDEQAGFGHLVSWGPDAATPGGFIFTAIDSDGTGTTERMRIGVKGNVDVALQAAPASPAAVLAGGGTLAAGTAYFYVVTAVNGAGGETAKSVEVTATPTVLGVPASPAAALAAGGTLTVGTAYFYVVTALNSAGETTQSAEVTATPTSGNQTINITWTAVAGAVSYKVYRSTTTGSYATPALVGNPATNSLSDTGVTANAGAPPATNTSGYQTIVLSWSAVPGAAFYRLYRTTTSGVYTSPAMAGFPSAVSFTDSGVTMQAGAPPASATASAVRLSPNGASWFNGGNVGIGNAAPLPVAVTGYNWLIVGPSAASTTYGLVCVCGNSTTSGSAMGAYNFVNYGSASADQRLGYITAILDGAANSGAISFVTYNAGTGAEWMRINSTGHVGIGTALPRGLLEVCTDSITDTYRGLISAQYAGPNPHSACLWFIRGRGTHTAPAASVAGDYAMSIISMVTTTDLSLHDVATITAFVDSVGAGTAAGDLAFATNSGTANSAERMRITSTGNVGIGTSSPATLFHVYSTASPQATLEGTTAYVSYRLKSDTRTYQISTGGSTTSGYAGTLWIYDETASAPRILLTGTGLVGIGTTTPNAMCEAYAPTVGDTAGAVSTYILDAHTNSSNGQDMGVHIYASRHTAGTDWTGVAMRVQHQVQGSPLSYISFNPPAGSDAGSLAFGYVNTDFMRITTGGNVGIGLIGPTVRLDILSNDNTDSGGCLRCVANNQSVNATYSFGGITSTFYYKIIASSGLMLQPAGGKVCIATTTGSQAPLTVYSGGGGYGIDVASSAYGAYLYNDGGNFYVLLTNQNDPYGAYNGLRPFYIALATGVTYIGNGANISGGLTTSGSILMNSGMLRVGANAVPSTNGDLGVARDSAPTTGVVYFGNNQGNRIYFDGTNWNFSPALPAGTVSIGGRVTDGGIFAYWPSINFNNGSYITANAYNNIGGGYLTWYFNNTSPSDIRIKQNVRDLVGGLPIIERIRMREAEYNGLAGYQKGKRIVSPVAQELEEVLPTAIEPFKMKLHTEDKEQTDILTFDPWEIVWHMLLAVQQLSARLKLLEGKVN
jgi:hypothetical protein